MNVKRNVRVRKEGLVDRPSAVSFDTAVTEQYEALWQTRGNGEFITYFRKKSDIIKNRG